MQFKTEEVQRCVTGQKGKFFEVEVCVATTATYGDKFRGVCRHRYILHPSGDVLMSDLPCRSDLMSAGLSADLPHVSFQYHVYACILC